MGVILQGILGGFSGKVGPVVGGKWKDIDYMRSYVIPANPNTTAQQAVRAKFAAMVAAGRQLIPGVLQPFWDPFYSSMSGFNAWISANYAGATVAGVLNSSSIMAKGTLTPETISNAVLAGTSVTIDWTETTSGNADSNDNIVAVVYDKTTELFYFQLTPVTRDNEQIIVTVDSGLTATNLESFIFAYRGTGSELVVSDSNGSHTGT